MNAFAQYAETAAPKPKSQRRIDPRLGGVRALTGLDKKMVEKQRLSKDYRLARRKLRSETIASEPRLLAFLRYLRTVGPEQADELVEAVRTSWLIQASQPVRLLALEMVGRRCDRINRQFGILPLEDPLPPETDVFGRVQVELRKGGIL